MYNHLNSDKRIDIEKGLKEGKNFTEIANEIGVNKSTISREIKSKRYFIHHKNVTTIQTKNVCIHRYKCNIKEKCKNRKCFYRNKNCRFCDGCNGYCDEFEEEICTKYNFAPYVCNGCPKKPRCPLSKYLYDAKKAQKEYESVLSDSRAGISFNEEELKNINKIVSPLLRQGQSVQYICSHKCDELMVSDKTIYKLLSEKLLDADVFDLKRTVQRKLRKKAGKPISIDKKCRSGRTYEDFLNYISKNPDVSIVEMDTVEGKKGGKVILTLLFTNCNLQLAFLREHNDAASVSNIFKELRNILDPEEFILLFHVCLGDRGSEFSDPLKIEVDFETEEIQSSVFYCDPQNSSQKAHCERNHEFIRYIIPKGTSLDHLTQSDINIMMNHINSYGREKFNWKSPTELFENIYGSKITKKLGIKFIHPDDIILTPKLLKK